MGSNITVQKTSFCSTVTRDLLTNEIKQLLTSQNWDLGWGHYHKLNMPSVFHVMRKSQVQTLFLWRNDCGNIFKDIGHVSFVKIQYLFLDHNNIASIEALGWMSMPQVQMISLASNRIRSLKPLQKANLTKLNVLFLQCNQITQIYPLTRARFQQFLQTSSSLPQLKLDKRQGNDKSTLINDLTSVIKIDIIKLQGLSMYGEDRIRQYGLYRAMKKRWRGVRVTVQMEEIDIG